LAGAGLSTRDVQAVRAALAAGRRTKVVFTAAAGQIAGQTGQIIQLTDPATSDDFVVVRFGRDELPFTPAEVSIPPRAPAGRKPKPPRGSARAAAPDVAAPDPEAAGATRDTDVAGATDGGSAGSPGTDDAGAAGATAAPSQRTPADAADATMPVGAAPASGSTQRQEKQSVDSEQTPAAPTRRAPRQAKPKPPAALTVTLSYTDGEWMVGATQGAKALAKPYVIKPAEALKFVGLLDVPGVHEAVEHIIAAERDTARNQAERLRAELAEIEAKLAELGA
jgi:hypothetical protein